MDAKRITDARQWDGFVGAQPESQFLQSWAWGDFQAAVGRRVFRLGVLDHDRLIGAAQGILQDHGYGIRSFSIYRGPVLDAQLSTESFTQALEAILELTKACAREHGAAYLHIEPPYDGHAPAATLLNDRPGWRTVPSSQPVHSRLLSLGRRSADLLAAMHEKTRYNIRLAERKGVSVSLLTGQKDLDPFLALLHQTAHRDGITVHPDRYFQKMAEILAPKNFLTIFSTRFKGHVCAANLVYHFGDTVTYAHGASGNEDRNVMAPHLLQWEQIEWAEQLRARWYDFWGIAPNNASDKHPWAGITRFKQGFGGDARAYLPAMEKSLSGARYALVRLRRRLR